MREGRSVFNTTYVNGGRGLRRGRKQNIGGSRGARGGGGGWRGAPEELGAPQCTSLVLQHYNAIRTCSVILLNGNFTGQIPKVSSVWNKNCSLINSILAVKIFFSPSPLPPLSPPCYIIGKESVRGLPVICGCGWTMERRDVNDHISTECLYTVVTSKYRRIRLSM